MQIYKSGKKVFSFLTKSTLFGNFFIYVGSSILNAAIPFLLLPLFTKYLSPYEYGILAIFSTFNAFLSPLVGISSIGIISKEYFNQENTNFGQYVGNILIVYIFSIPPVIVIVLLAANFIDILEVPVFTLYLSLFFSIFTFLVSMFLALWKAASKAKSYALFQVSNTILTVASSIILVVFLEYGWLGRVASQLFSIVCFGIIGYYLIVKNFKISYKINREYIADILKVSIPLIPHSLGAIIISLSDRIIITELIDLKATGLYSVGYTIGSIIGVIEHSFNLAFVPWLFEKLNQDDLIVKKKIVKYTYLYFIIILVLVVILTFSSPLIFYFLDDRFSGASIFVFWIALSFAFSGMYKMVTNYIFYVKKTHFLAIITFSCAILNIILNIVLIKYIGAVGAAVSAAIVSAIFFFTTWFLSNKVYPMPWSLLVTQRR